MVTNKYKFTDVINAYTDEQMDRQVFWMLQKIPELENTKNKNVMDESRVSVAFQSQIISYQLVAFYHDY